MSMFAQNQIPSLPSEPSNRFNPLQVSIGVNINDTMFKDFISYRSFGLSHFTAYGVPMILFDNIIRFLGSTRLSKVMRGVVKPALNFIDISGAREMDLDQKGFAEYFEANAHELKKTLRICVNEHGEETTFKLLGASLSDYSNGAANRDTLVKLYLNGDMKSVSDAEIEALCRLNYLIDKLGEFDFCFGGHEEARFANEHTILFFNKNRLLIEYWLEGCMASSGKNNKADYLRAYHNNPMSENNLDPISDEDIAKAFTEKSDDSEDTFSRVNVAKAVMAIIGDILNKSHSKYTDNGLPF